MRSAPPTEKPTKYAIYLSAVFPGLGQFHQRRWVTGAIFLGLFAACLIGLLGLILPNIFGNTGVALDSAGPIVVYVILAVLVYVMSFCDTILAYVRRYKSWAERRLVEKFLQPGLVIALILSIALTLRADDDDALRSSADAAALGIAGNTNVAEEVDAAIVANRMHRAIRDGAILQVDDIIERYGAEASRIPVENGVTPLHIAAALNDDVTTAILMARGAEIDARTLGGFTPLHWAAGRDALKTAKLLVAIGADIDACTPEGVTPAHWAADKNSTNVLRLLILAGADINAETVKGLTPLHWAVRKNSLEAGHLIAFKRVMNEGPKRVAAATDQAPAATGPIFQIEVVPPVSDTQAIPRAEFGRSLLVPLGRGQSLEFIWIESMGLWVGRYEVTNGQFRRFRYKHRSLFREEFSLDGDDQPVVYVSWNDADDFCSWLNKNFSARLPPDCVFRLPSDAEWTAFAACGTNRKYPWGDTWPPRYGNLSDNTARKHLPSWQGIRHYDDGHIVTCPVAESGENEWGICGLAGNVWEWCEDWYGEDRKYKVRRGGSWDFDPEDSLLLTSRGFDRPTARYDTIGFRVAVSRKK